MASALLSPADLLGPMSFWITASAAEMCTLVYGNKGCSLASVQVSDRGKNSNKAHFITEEWHMWTFPARFYLVLKLKQQTGQKCTGTEKEASD